MNEHLKVEAGWEKAEAEALALKNHLEGGT
jgi:hypothetical protein